jgi:hypothetical protein
MEQSTKKKLLIGGSLLVVASVGGYFLYKYLKNKREAEAKKKADADAAAAAANQPKLESKPKTDVLTNFGPFVSSDGVKLFQDWMDTNHPNWVNGKNLNKGSGYGKFGPSTSKAWDSYGTAYSKPVAPTSNPEAATDAVLVNDPKVMVPGDTVYIKKWDGVPVNYRETGGNGGVSAYTGFGLVTKMDGGGSVSFGNFYYGTKVGTVLKTDSVWGSVQIRNNQNPVTKGGITYTDFWMPIAAVTKTENSLSFNGMTVSRNYPKF